MSANLIGTVESLGLRLSRRRIKTFFAMLTLHSAAGGGSPIALYQALIVEMLFATDPEPVFPFS